MNANQELNPIVKNGSAGASAFDLEGLTLVRLVAQHGSFAAAARASGRVPSAITYAVRQLENSLDVLLFDRGRNRTTLTAAGRELLTEGERLLSMADALADRVRDVAGGWERDLTIGLDAAISFDALAPLVTDFDRLRAPTRLRFKHHVLAGGWDALHAGSIDLGIGLPAQAAPHPHPGRDGRPDTGMLTLGSLPFVFCVAPDHPLAVNAGCDPLPQSALASYRAIVVADSMRDPGSTHIGVLPGQPTMLVPTLEQKIAAQIAGLGVGYLPEPFARQALADGRLRALTLTEPPVDLALVYAWRRGPGRAREWWLQRLSVPAVRAALLSGPAG
ncbi:MAG: LysR family transcriptional regulator [Burkholderiaceae bacterium]